MGVVDGVMFTVGTLGIPAARGGTINDISTSSSQSSSMVKELRLCTGVTRAEAHSKYENGEYIFVRAAPPNLNTSAYKEEHDYWTLRDALTVALNDDARDQSRLLAAVFSHMEPYLYVVFSYD